MDGGLYRRKGRRPLCEDLVHVHEAREGRSFHNVKNKESREVRDAFGGRGVDGDAPAEGMPHEHDRRGRLLSGADGLRGEGRKPMRVSYDKRAVTARVARSTASRTLATATASSARVVAERSASSSVTVAPWPRISNATTRHFGFSAAATRDHVRAVYPPPCTHSTVGPPEAAPHSYTRKVADLR